MEKGDQIHGIWPWTVTSVATLLFMLISTAHAQVPGTPLVAARDTLIGVIPSVSIESGYFRHRVDWVTPLALRLGIETDRLGATLGVVRIASRDNGVGYGVGSGFGLNLWAPKRTSFLAFGGRLQTAVEYSWFEDSPGGSRRQLDVPVTLALVHDYPALTFIIKPWIAPLLQARVIDDGEDRDLRWLTGASLGIEAFKARCAPGEDSCMHGWGFRLGVELVRDLEHGPFEGGATFSLLWKFM